MVVVQESISVHYQRENGDVILEIRYKFELDAVSCKIIILTFYLERLNRDLFTFLVHC